jgi:hypothetical protein
VSREYTWLVRAIKVADGWRVFSHTSLGHEHAHGKYRWRWQAKAVAKRLCRSLADEQGENLRLELHVEGIDRFTRASHFDVTTYGRDPRSIQ